MINEIEWKTSNKPVEYDFSVSEMKKHVLEIMKKMARVVDSQNLKDPSMKGSSPYIAMSDNFDKSTAFKAACELVFHGKTQPSGYTEPILHLNRLLKKN